MLTVIRFIEIVSSIGLLTSLLSGILVIFLTHYVIKRNFGAYKWLITNFAASGMLFTAVEHAVTPVLHNFKSGMCLFTVRKPVWVMEILLCVCVGFLSSTISLLAVQFIYRYLAVFNSPKLKYFNGLKILFWISYPFVIGAVRSLSAHHFSSSDEFSNRYFEKEIYDCYDVHLPSIANLAIIVYDDTNPLETKANSKNIYYFIITSTILFIQYFIILFFGFHMNRHVKTMTSSLSGSLRRLHRQFFEALVLQIIAPSVVIFIPTLVSLAIPFLNYRISFPTGIFVALISLYPAIDATILIFVVSEYSRSLKRMISSILF